MSISKTTPATDKLLTDLHISYIQELGKASVSSCAGFHCELIWSIYWLISPLQNKDDLIYHLTAHLRLNAVYWGFTSLCILGHPEALNRDEMIDFVMSCWDEEAGIVIILFLQNYLHLYGSWLYCWYHPSRCFFIITGAFGAHPDHDGHLLSTLSAIQILITQDALDRMDKGRVVKCDSIQHAFSPYLI